MASIKKTVVRTVNKRLPKLKNILVTGNEKVESNAVEMANYLSQNTKSTIYFMASKEFAPYFKKLLQADVKIIQSGTISFWYALLASKYFFSTHGTLLENSSKKQIQVNIWHGVLYKKIRKMRGYHGINVDYTIGTSPLSQKLFAEAFGVSESSVIVSGYPRNDMMLRARKEKDSLKRKIEPDLSQYDQIVFWMPTFRRKSEDSAGNLYELKTDNPFHVEDFDVAAFNDILKANNTLCLLKPHYFYMSKDSKTIDYSHIKMIDEHWIAQQGITLYQLLACTDVLISDFSSVLIDYMLLDLPTICFCTDLEEYKKTQGLYFEDIENWLPSKLIQEQQVFFDFLSEILTTGNDPYASKRQKLLDTFFTYKDGNSSKRIVDKVLNANK